MIHWTSMRRTHIKQWSWRRNKDQLHLLLLLPRSASSPTFKISNKVWSKTTPIKKFLIWFLIICPSPINSFKSTSVAPPSQEANKRPTPLSSTVTHRHSEISSKTPISVKIKKIHFLISTSRKVESRKESIKFTTKPRRNTENINTKQQVKNRMKASPISSKRCTPKSKTWCLRTKLKMKTFKVLVTNWNQKWK